MCAKKRRSPSRSPSRRLSIRLLPSTTGVITHVRPFSGASFHTRSHVLGRPDRPIGQVRPSGQARDVSLEGGSRVARVGVARSRKGKSRVARATSRAHEIALERTHAGVQVIVEREVSESRLTVLSMPFATENETACSLSPSSSRIGSGPWCMDGAASRASHNFGRGFWYGLSWSQPNVFPELGALSRLAPDARGARFASARAGGAAAFSMTFSFFSLEC